jgi:hypothetical protein
MIGHGEKFSRKKESALAALLECSSLPEAAASCGISESTLRRWLRNDSFATQYRIERSRLLEITINQLRQKSLSAVNVLAKMSDDEASPAAVRVSAARAIISLGIAGEMLEVEDRLSDLEEIAKG